MPIMFRCRRSHQSGKAILKAQRIRWIAVARLWIVLLGIWLLSLLVSYAVFVNKTLSHAVDVQEISPKMFQQWDIDHRTAFNRTSFLSGTGSPFLTTLQESSPEKSVSTKNAIIQLTIDNILWSRNYYRHAKCSSVPEDYYSLKNVRKWCKARWTTECIHKVEAMKSWFRSCNGTIWIRSQSNKDIDQGDLSIFIHDVLPLINQPFDLITTDGDNSIPRHVPAADILLSNRFLETWYTQNYDVGTVTPSTKLRAVPIGLDLHSIAESQRMSTTEVLEKMNAIRDAAAQGPERNGNVYIPPMSTSSNERIHARDGARCLNSTTDTRFLSPFALFEKYTQYRFGVSPRGNGVDCHRTWEMLMFGMIPIVQSGPLDAMFEKFDLPVVIVKDWKEFCQEGFLEAQYAKLQRKIPMDNRKLTTGFYVNRCTDCISTA